MHVADLASVHLSALEYLAAGGKPVALNLGTGTGRSIQEVIRAIEIVGRRAARETHRNWLRIQRWRKPCLAGSRAIRAWNRSSKPPRAGTPAGVSGP
jgi:nucleoside-diphosphate-sugar epimerase